MKHFIISNRHRFLQGIPSAMLISFSIYLFLRIIFHDFPMTWAEEIGFFLKVVVIGGSLIVLATGSCAATHSIYKRYIKHRPTA